MACPLVTCDYAVHSGIFRMVKMMAAELGVFEESYRANSL